MLRRDGGCARPGCTETRIERLHAHHMRWWMFGGRTDVAGMVLLCDVDHGLVHDLDLVMTRRDGKLIVLTQDGRRVWGEADTAFAGGVESCSSPEAPIQVPALRAVSSADPATAMTRVLFPDGPPPLPDAMHVNGERMDMRYVVGVLMGNRDLERRLAAEARGEPALAA
jgi:hypothetical protein